MSTKIQVTMSEDGPEVFGELPENTTITEYPQHSMLVVSRDYGAAILSVHWTTQQHGVAHLITIENHTDQKPFLRDLIECQWSEFTTHIERVITTFLS